VNGDSSTATVAITISGVNDLAEILGKAAGHVAEDSVTKATGKLTIIDVDHGENSAVAQSNTTGDYGSFSIDSSGAWTYVLDNASMKVQGLSCDETVQDSFAVKSLDGTASKTVVITIEGTNDDAVVGSPTVRDVTEDQSVVSGKLTAEGTISISDADHGEAAFQTKVYGSSHNLGSLTLASDGTYTYSVANSAVQNLGTNDTKLDSFNIKALDGTAKTVAFSIHGANELINVGSHATVAATAGPDTFVFASPASAGSTITGFSAGSDLLQISASGFGHGLAANTGASLVNAADHNAAFHTGAGGYFIFDNRGSDAGTVFWDATGGHGDDATALVKLPGMTSLMSSDFHLV